MQKKRVTPEQEAEMKELGKSMTAKQISLQLGMPYSTVQYYMSAKSIKRKLGKIPQERHGHYTKEKGKPGMFNIYQRENWLI
jgi:predicted transcriptional regulator